MRLRKYHGLGNDYLVLETARAVTPALVVALCDRHRGVGADGLLEPLPVRRGEDGRPVSHYAVRIWNPDGSKAEKSGNGLRIYARWLRAQRAAPATHDVEVRLDERPGELARCRVEPAAAGGLVEVDMGRARFEAAAVPVLRPLLRAPVEVEGVTLAVTAVGAGNPHCVVLLDEVQALDSSPWRRWGAALERHPLFPNRTNVQFAAVAPAAPGDPPGSSRLVARIWERGAGETSASGSSACAVAAVAARLGLARSPVIVQMPGGELWVQVGEDLGLTLRGPVEEVGAVEVAASWLATRGL